MKHAFRLYLYIYVSFCAAIPAYADPRRVVVLVGDCSGVCVDPTGIVLTARHCDLPETVQVRFPHKTVRAQRIYVCPETEGPVVFDCDGEGFPHAPLATALPKSGERVWSFGYPAKGNERKLHRVSGHLVRGGTFTFRGGEFRGNVVDFRTGPGWSGGPLLNERGEVCGLLSSGDCRSSVFISFAATKTAVENARWKPVEPEPVKPDPRPILYVFTSATCGPCRDWHRDYADVADFRKELDVQYRVVVIDVDRQPELARQYGIESVPAFVVVGRPPLFGYSGTDELLVRLFPKSNPKPDTELVARPPIKTTPPSDAAPAKEPATEAKPAVSPTPEKPNNDPLAQRVDRLAAVVETTLTITTWLGITGATGGLGGLLWGGLSLLRRLRRRTSTAKPGRDPPPPASPPPNESPKADSPVVVDKPPVVTIDSPPPPQVIVPETRFAPYERDTFAEAFAWAETEIARKYPGAVGTLESLRSLIDQYLAAKRHKA